VENPENFVEPLPGEGAPVRKIARKKGSADAAEAMTCTLEPCSPNRASLSTHKRCVRESGCRIVELVEVTAFESVEPPSAGYVHKAAHSAGLSQDELAVDGLALLLERA
jgi:hypothetical protein